MSVEASQQKAPSESTTSPSDRGGEVETPRAPRWRRWSGRTQPTNDRAHPVRSRTARSSDDSERLAPLPPLAREAQVPEARAGVGQGSEDKRVEVVDGARLLTSDLEVAFALFNEARYRAIERLFGVRRDQVNLLTLVGALAVAGALEKTIDQLRGRWHPTRRDALVGFGFFNALGDGMAGPASRKAPAIGLVVATAVVGIAVHRSAHDVKASSHRMRLSFSHRYGHRPRPVRER